MLSPATSARTFRRRALACGLGVVCAAAMATGALAQFGANKPRNLYNGDDPTLSLTGNGVISGPAPAGSAPPNPDPHDLEGHWWIEGTHKLFGPALGVPPHDEVPAHEVLVTLPSVLH